MRNLPLGPEADGVDFISLMLEYIRKFDDLAKKQVWVHNTTYQFPIDSDPESIPIHHSDL